jgi:hypothetical protein
MVERLLRSRHAARILFVALAAVIVVSVFVRFYVLPACASPAPAGSAGPYAEVWANIVSYLTDAGLEASFATIIIGVLFLTLIPEEVRLGKIETIYPNDIRSALLQEISDTDEYYFRGRSARWFRSNVLPVLAKQARLGSRTKKVYLLLPDPSSGRLMQDYADYRNSIAYSSKPTPWTAWDVEKEILATLISLAHVNNQSVLMHVEVGMLDSYALMRVDMAGGTAMLTREDPKLSAIRCARGSTLYDSTKEEILQGIAQGRPLTLPLAGPRGRPLDEQFALDLLNSHGFQTVAADQARVAEILEAALKPEDPYK